MASVYTVLEYLGQDVKIPDNYSHFIDLHSNLLLCFKSFFLFLLQFEISFSPEIFILQSSRGSRPGCRRWYRPLYVCVCGLHFFLYIVLYFPNLLEDQGQVVEGDVGHCRRLPLLSTPTALLTSPGICTRPRFHHYFALPLEEVELSTPFCFVLWMFVLILNELITLTTIVIIVAWVEASMRVI